MNRRAQSTAPVARHDLPPATVVIPTRDRGDSIVRTIRSVLAGTVAPTAVLISDQSSGEHTSVAVAPLLSDARIRYARTPTSGISAALNAGVARASTEYVAITGDDCEVAPTWLEELLRELCGDPRTGAVFGAVLAGDCDPSSGFHPSYTPGAQAIARSIYQKHKVGGTSACMAIRRTVWERLGGFDEVLGVGSALRSAEDTDFAIRTLLAGFTVRETAAAEVIHHGYFRYEERSQLIDRNWYGTGAAFVKPLKMGHPEILIALLRVCLSWANGGSRVAAGLGTGPHHLASLSAFLKGAWAGLLHPIDRPQGRFRARTPTIPA